VLRLVNRSVKKTASAACCCCNRGQKEHLTGSRRPNRRPVASCGSPRHNHLQEVPFLRLDPCPNLLPLFHLKVESFNKRLHVVKSWVDLRQDILFLRFGAELNGMREESGRNLPRRWKEYWSRIDTIPLRQKRETGIPSRKGNTRREK
jgi:hypothetical protein